MSRVCWHMNVCAFSPNSVLSSWAKSAVSVPTSPSSTRDDSIVVSFQIACGKNVITVPKNCRRSVTGLTTHRKFLTVVPNRN